MVLLALLTVWTLLSKQNKTCVAYLSFLVSQDLSIKPKGKIAGLLTVLLDAVNNITIDILIKDNIDFLLTNKRKDVYLIKFIGKFYPDIEKLPLSYLNLIKTLKYENAAVEVGRTWCTQYKN